MSDWDTLRLMGNIALAVCALGAIAMPVVYTVLTRWWHSATGRLLMTLMVAVLAVFVINIIGVLWAGYTFRLVLRLVLYIIVAGMLWTVVAALIRVQILGNDDHDPRHSRTNRKGE